MIAAGRGNSGRRPRLPPIYSSNRRSQCSPGI